MLVLLLRGYPHVLLLLLLLRVHQRWRLLLHGRGHKLLASARF